MKEINDLINKIVDNGGRPTKIICKSMSTAFDIQNDPNTLSTDTGISYHTPIGRLIVQVDTSIHADVLVM